MSKKNDQEEGKSPLNSDKGNDTLRVNRGVELLLRNKRRKTTKPKTFQVKFGKMFSFLNREIELYFNFHLDFRKRKSQGE
jgi:hypothetical protein